MKDNRIFKVFTVLAFTVIMVLAAYRVGPATEPIRLGFVGPLSGELSSYGIPALRGVELAIEDVNTGGGIRGRQVDLYVEDDLCKPKDASIKASKIIRQMRTKKMKAIFISGDGIKDKAFIVSAGKFAEGVYATAPKHTSNIPGAIAVTSAYKEAYGTYPGTFFLNAYAAAKVIMVAIQEAGSTDYVAVLKALKSTHVDTPLGKISFDERGDAMGPGLGFSVYRVEKGVFVEVK